MQHAVIAVAGELSAHDTVTWKGLTSSEIRSACTLDVVAFDKGSFCLALDLQRSQPQIQGLDLGERALEALVAGLGELQGGGHQPPNNFRPAALVELRHVGRLLGDGIDRIELTLKTRQCNLAATYDEPTLERVRRMLERPSERHETIEGRLLMADFNEPRTRCRIHPAAGEPVQCTFDPHMMEEVQENLRSFVRAKGEGQRDPSTGRVISFQILEIDPLEVETEATTIGGSEFWQEKSVEELARDQGVAVPQPLDEIIGKGVDLWEDEADFDSFVGGIYERRRSTEPRSSHE